MDFHKERQQVMNHLNRLEIKIDQLHQNVKLLLEPTQTEVIGFNAQNDETAKQMSKMPDNLNRKNYTRANLSALFRP